MQTPPRKLTIEELKELEIKHNESVIQRRNDSFRRANDIRYKDPKDLKPYQLPLFYEIKIREEIDALEKEIEQQEFNLKVQGLKKK
jgi:hypothetical protein